MFYGRLYKGYTYTLVVFLDLSSLHFMTSQCLKYIDDVTESLL